MARQKPDALTAMSLTTASPVIGMPTMTVGELAEQLSASPEEIPAVRERLRHWTREGFMFPLARHHAGSGRHRQYDQSSTYDAAILNALARAGLHIISRPYVTEMLAKAHQARQAWQSAKKRGPLFLEISHAANGGAVIAVREGTAKSVPPAELTIVIDLRQIFLACENKMAERDSVRNA